MPAIPQVKVTMQFALGSIGWGESHIFNVTSLADGTLMPAMIALAAARAQVMGPNVSFVQVKASLESLNRDVIYVDPTKLPQLSTGTVSGNPVANYPNGPMMQTAVPPFVTLNTGWWWQSPHLSWPLKLQDADNNELAICYIAGMPASSGQWGPGPTQSVSTSAASFLSKYMAYLLAGGWGVSSLNWPPNAFNLGNATQITAASYAQAVGTGTGIFNFTVPQAVVGGTLQPGAKIRIGGFTYTTAPKRARLNGTYTVLKYASGMCSVLVPRVTADPGFSGLGFMQMGNYGFQPYTKGTLDNITHRKRGRVPLTPRGRR